MEVGRIMKPKGFSTRSRQWIGQSKPRKSQGGATGGSQFSYEYQPGWRGAIAREFLAHGMVSLHGRSLIKWERKVYDFGAEQGLPFPRCIDSRDTTIVTELVGPSVKMLLERSDLPVRLDEAEIGSLILRTVREDALVADAGIQQFDGHLNNKMVWLEHGLDGGNLEFNQIKIADHTYTLVRGLNFKKPLWCSVQMPHFPPEAKADKLADEAAFAELLRQEGFVGASLGDIVRLIAMTNDGQQQRASRWKLERLYDEHAKPQRLQAALDAGAIDPHLMAQYCLGKCFLELLALNDTPATTRRVMGRLKSVFQKMADPRPEERFSNLHAAAAAIQDIVGAPLERSRQSWPPISPKELIWDVRGTTDPDPAPPDLEEAPDAGTYDLGTPSPVAAVQDIIQENVETKPAVRKPFGALGKRLRDWYIENRGATVAVALILTLTVLTSVRLPQTPEDFLRSAQKAQVARLIERLDVDQVQEVNDSISKLRAILSQSSEPVRSEAHARLNKKFTELESKYLGRALVSVGSQNSHTINDLSVAQKQAVIRQLDALASLGNEAAKQWLEMLREHNRVIRQIKGRQVLIAAK